MKIRNSGGESLVKYERQNPFSIIALPRNALNVSLFLSRFRFFPSWHNPLSRYRRRFFPPLSAVASHRIGRSDNGGISFWRGRDASTFERRSFSSIGQSRVSRAWRETFKTYPSPQETLLPDVSIFRNWTSDWGFPSPYVHMMNTFLALSILRMCILFNIAEPVGGKVFLVLRENSLKLGIFSS